MKIEYLSPEGVLDVEQAALREIESKLPREWLGFGAFQLVIPRNNPLDIDLLVLTPNRILVVELKNWAGKIESSNGQWIHKGTPKKSPVIVTTSKARALVDPLAKALGYGTVPYIEPLIVLCHPSAHLKLDARDSQYTLTLSEFCALGESKKYLARYPLTPKGMTRPSINPLNSLGKYKLYFSPHSNHIRQIKLSVHGYQQDDESPEFRHPKGLFEEFNAHHVESKDSKGLMRRWDFTALANGNTTLSERTNIALREVRLNEHIRLHSDELHRALLEPVGQAVSDDVTTNYAEVYRIAPKLERLETYLNRRHKFLGLSECVGLSKAIINRYAQLHTHGIAHRDISTNSLWIEAPSKIVMSSFSAAYFPEQKTVSLYHQELESGSVLLPEDKEDGIKTTPFLRDVFLLGVVVYQVLYGKKIGVTDGVPSFETRGEKKELLIFDSWFETALSWTPECRFADANSALDRLNELAPQHNGPALSNIDFEAYSTNSSPATFMPVEQISMTHGKWVYKTRGSEGDFLVKIWSNLGFDEKHPGRNQKILRFLETARSMRLNPSSDYPQIIDFGIGPMGLILINSWTEGEALAEWLVKPHADEIRATLAIQAMTILLRLHSNGFVHGDIKPDNIIVRKIVDGNAALTLIDLPDLQQDGADGHTPAFSATEVLQMSSKHRDLLAIALTVKKIIDLGNTEYFSNFKIQLERAIEEASNGVPLEILISELQNTITKNTGKSVPNVFDIYFNGSVPQANAGRLASDNGKFYVAVRKGQRNDGILNFTISGITHKIIIDVDVENSRVARLQVRAQGHIEYVKQVSSSDFIVDAQITVHWNSVNSAADLIKYLLVRAQISDSAESNEISENGADKNLHSNKTIELNKDRANQIISTRELWKAMAHCEQENATSVTLLEGAVPDPINSQRLLVPFELDAGTVDFSKNEDVNVLMKYYDAILGEVKWKTVGKLNAELTSGTMLAIEELRPSFSAAEGSQYRLRSRLEDIAIWRRQQAIDRILDGSSLIKNLPELFDPKNNIEPFSVSLPEGLDVSKYGLNEEQNSAIINVLQKGPLSLLQGPPGTGKTKFISAFIHCLISNGLANNVLLVSQSHEAINHALDKTNLLSIEHSTPMSIVRVGQENMLSESIKPLHDLAQQQAFRERFSSEIKIRITKAANAIGLPAEYVNDAVALHLNLGDLAEKLAGIDVAYAAQPGTNTEDLVEKKRLLLTTFRAITASKYQTVVEGGDYEKTYRAISADLAKLHGVTSPIAENKLKELVALSLEFRQVLGNPRANFTSFLTHSCQIVAGTCVGIGRHTMGIVDHSYDWVIIDEAARSSPTELAVAMQAGKRILLVGDHKQLPPTYSKDFIKSISKAIGEVKLRISALNDFSRAFSSVYGSKTGSFLTTQYRMAPLIGRVVSNCFYEGKLRTGRDGCGPEYDLLPDALSKEICWVDTSDLGSLAHDQKPDGSESRINEAEVNCILATLRTLAESKDFLDKLALLDDEGFPIGVICMYAAQRDLIRHRFNQSDWAAPIRDFVKIGTVDSYQGKENRIILLSLVCNNDKNDIGFLGRPERINVAMSRAMDRLIIFGATAMWRERRGTALFNIVNEVSELQKEGLASIYASKAITGVRK